MVINENQLKRILEFKSKEYQVVDVAKQLKNLPCTGESVKTLIYNKLSEVGYQGIKITFIGHEDETHDLMYSIYTEDGPMFVIKAQSTHGDTPCMEITYVQAYDKVNL